VVFVGEVVLNRRRGKASTSDLLNCVGGGLSKGFGLLRGGRGNFGPASKGKKIVVETGEYRSEGSVQSSDESECFFCSGGNVAF